MKNLILVILSVISAVTCNEFIVLSSPKSVEFKGNSDLPAESLSDVLSAALGYSISSPLSWNGLFVNDPFNVAKSVVSVVVEGADDLKFQNAKSFNIAGNEVNFESDLLNKVTDHEHLAIDVDLIDKLGEGVQTLYGELEASAIKDDVQFLKPKTNKHDKEFLNQIAYLRSLINLFTEQKEKPTALNVRVSLKMLSASGTSEAKKLLASTIERLNAAVEKAYDGNAVFAVINVHNHHHRSKRQATSNDYNLAELTDPNYPVVFNIMLWFTVIMIFTLIAISLALSNVEDKDSIIYRMTGARGKKEN